MEVRNAIGNFEKESEERNLITLGNYGENVNKIIQCCGRFCSVRSENDILLIIFINDKLPT